MFKLRGRLVAGIGPIMQEGQPPVWSTYVPPTTPTRPSPAPGGGRRVIVEPMDVMDAGRMAFVAHPAGGYVGLWQPGRHTGAELVNEPGTLNWNELHTRDVEGAKAFYRRCSAGPPPTGLRRMTYTIFNLGENGIGGMMPMQPGVPDEVPAYWLVPSRSPTATSPSPRRRSSAAASPWHRATCRRWALRGPHRPARHDVRGDRPGAARRVVTPPGAAALDSRDGAPGWLGSPLLDGVQGLAQCDGPAR